MNNDNLNDTSNNTNEKYIYIYIYTYIHTYIHKVGKSGAGTDWVNPNGHAFVKRGSGVPNTMQHTIIYYEINMI